MYLPYNIFQLHIFILLSSLGSSIGRECQSDHNCPLHQFCNIIGSCNCQPGYVRHIDHCFKIVKYGEVCFFNEQCNDHRQVCQATSEIKELKHCICDEYHTWDEEQYDCVHAQNLTSIVRTLEEKTKTKWKENIEKKGISIFTVQVIAGIVAVSVGVVLFGLCIIYGRCCRRKPKLPIPLSQHPAKDSRQVAGQDSTEGVYMPIFTDLT